MRTSGSSWANRWFLASAGALVALAACFAIGLLNSVMITPLFMLLGFSLIKLAHHPITTTETPRGETTSTPQSAQLSDEVAHTIGKTMAGATKTSRRFIDSMPLGLLTLDSEGTIKYANQKALAVIGQTVEDVSGQSVCRFIRLNETSSIFSELCNAALDTLVEGRTTPVDEVSIPIDFAIGTIELSGGQSGYIVTLTDISHRYEIERMREEFLSMLSHDLRTPLTAVNIFLYQVLTMEDLNTTIRTRAETAQTAVNRLIKMVTSLLDVNLMRSGKMSLELRPCDPGEIISAAASSLAPLAAQKNIVLKTTCTSLPIAADRDRIYQVVENLLGNAIKFAPEGSEISISAVNQENSSLFEITDQGPGIPEDIVPRLFSRFEQVSKTDQRDHRGYGLGLAICKFIVCAHNGQIGVNSRVGQGSTFWFCLSQ